uniref:Microfibril associated protein 5 n=1 Tax=Bos mutus grunniens TaxID=30521 RepID=A0A8B9X342_BOSMU
MLDATKAINMPNLFATSFSFCDSPLYFSPRVRILSLQSCLLLDHHASRCFSLCCFSCLHFSIPCIYRIFTDLVNDPATDETVLADIQPSTDDLASLNDKNTTTECRDEKFACTRLYSVHRPIKQCLHQICFTSSRRMYVINNEICSRLVCKEHEAMKDELCRQKAGLPPRRLRRSNYFRLPPCDNVNMQGPSGL